MKLAKDELVAALRLRYDYYSAQTIFEAACQRAQLEDQASYDAAQVSAFRDALARVGDRIEIVNERIDHLLGTSAAEPAAAPDPAPAPAPAPVAAPVATPAPVVAPAPAAVTAPVPEPTPAPEPRSRKHRARTEPSSYETQLVLRGVALEPGDQVLVCGDRDELGNWDPEHACPMTRDGDRWLATITIPPGTKGSYKFLRRTKGGTFVWEAGDDRGLESLPKIEATWQ